MRALLLTPENRLLLIQMQEPQSGVKHWAAPSGGMEAGESAAEALRREIYEETGLRDLALGPPIWHRENVFTWDGTTYHNRETYYLIRTAQFQPVLTVDDQEEIDAFCQFRWWTAGEIARSADPFIPNRLGAHFHALVTQGIPDAPVDVGA